MQMSTTNRNKMIINAKGIQNICTHCQLHLNIKPTYRPTHLQATCKYAFVLQSNMIIEVKLEMSCAAAAAWHTHNNLPVSA